MKAGTAAFTSILARSEDDAIVKDLKYKVESDPDCNIAVLIN